MDDHLCGRRWSNPNDCCGPARVSSRSALGNRDDFLGYSHDPRQSVPRSLDLGAIALFLTKGLGF